MMDRRHTSTLEDRVGLRVLFAERISFDAMMFEKLFRLHPWRGLSSKNTGVRVDRPASSGHRRMDVPRASPIDDDEKQEAPGS
ncbi:hypothetical protein [Paludisphaera borealis]|uniref:hypothetical protein n=1 Tax=Paludisphaera borealis TaxID=1387353 RepID=UPI00143D99A2|nr:hypothetical protein [Paludisphaera borealis]